MNDAPGGAVTVAPIGLPRGTWAGPVDFGGETPDPGAPCGVHGPYGLAQTAYPYFDPNTGAYIGPSQITLTDTTTG